MGADFVFEYVALKHNGLTREERKEKMLKAIDEFEIPELSDNPKQKVINSLKDKKSENFNEFCYLWEEVIVGDFNDGGFPTEDDEDLEEGILTEERAKEIMKKIVNEFFDGGNGRETGQFEFNGYTILLTGGMSWGDNPTDALNDFNKFNNLPKKIREAGEVE